MSCYMHVADLNEITRADGWSAEYATTIRDRLDSRQRVRYRKGDATIEACTRPDGGGWSYPGRVMAGTARFRESRSAPWRPIYSADDLAAYLASTS